MDAEVIRTGFGRVDIAKTDDRFPLGERGKRPVKFTVFDDKLIDKIKELEIPGILVRGARIQCAWDCAPVIAQLLGEPQCLDAAIEKRTTCLVPMPGLERYKELGLKEKLRPYQREAVRFMLRRAYALDGDAPRTGKTIVLLSVAVLSDIKKLLVLCNSLGKHVWAAEAAKWLGVEAVMLFGRSGHEIRVFCKTCMGSGKVIDEQGQPDELGVMPLKSCKACRQYGRSRGERLYNVRWLEPVHESRTYYEPDPAGRLKKDGTPRRKRGTARYCPLPAVFRCSAHEDEVDTHSRPCKQCLAELHAIIAGAQVVVGNYDIVMGQKDKTDTGVAFVRHDLPGWGPTLARFHFEMGIASECFVKGTMVSGKPIEEVQIGDMVEAFNYDTACIEQRRVTQTWVKPVKDQLVTVYLDDGRKLTSTPTHLYATLGGWTAAGKLEPGTEVYVSEKIRLPRELCSMREIPRHHTEEGVGNREQKADSRLRGCILLLSRMSQTLARQSDAQRCYTSSQNPDEARQSDEGPSRQSQGKCYATKNGPRPQSASRGLQCDDEAGKDSGRGARLAGANSRTFTETARLWLQVWLLNRRREPRVENRHRSGRPLSHGVCPQGTRREEGRPAEVSRVDRIEIHQPGSDGTFGGLCPDGKIYDIEVEGLHTFTANGVAVHNSHRIRGWKSKSDKASQTRVERVYEVMSDIERVYAETGTPVFGFTRDLFAQLSLISGGLW